MSGLGWDSLGWMVSSLLSLQRARLGVEPLRCVRGLAAHAHWNLSGAAPEAPHGTDAKPLVRQRLASRPPNLDHNVQPPEQAASQNDDAIQGMEATLRAGFDVRSRPTAHLEGMGPVPRHRHQGRLPDLIRDSQLLRAGRKTASLRVAGGGEPGGIAVVVPGDGTRRKLRSAL